MGQNLGVLYIMSQCKVVYTHLGQKHKLVGDVTLLQHMVDVTLEQHLSSHKFTSPTHISTLHLTLLHTLIIIFSNI